MPGTRRFMPPPVAAAPNPYMLSGWEEEEWLLRPDDAAGGGRDTLLASAAPPPAIASSLPAPIIPRTRPIAEPAKPPMTPLPAPSAIDQYEKHLRARPLRSDPELQSSGARKALGGIAGIASGALTGFINASGRSKADPTVGARLADTIMNAKYNRASRDWEDKGQGLSAQVQIEAQRIDDQRKKSETDARIAASKATEEAARARATAAGRTPTTKLEQRDPTKDLYDPTTGEIKVKGTPVAANPPNTIEARINRIRSNKDLTPEQQEAQVKVAVADYNALHPERPITDVQVDDKGNTTVIVEKPSEVIARGGTKVVGKVGKSKSQPVNQAGATAAVRRSVNEQAHEVLQKHNGDYTAALADVATWDSDYAMEVTNALILQQRNRNLATGSGGGVDVNKLAARLGFTPPGEAPAPTTPSVAPTPPAAPSPAPKPAVAKPAPPPPTATDKAGNKIVWNGSAWLPVPRR